MTASVAYYAGFIDVGFLRGEGAKVLGAPSSKVRPNAAGVVAWLKGMAGDQAVESPVESQAFLRAYWYDGAFDATHQQYSGQRSFFDAIAFTPGVQLRLGHIAERRSRLERPVRAALESTARGLGLDPGDLLAEFDKHWTFYPEREQKGVDTLIALDLVRLAQRGTYATAVLLSGDRDLAEAVRTAQDTGQRIVIATPSRASLAKELAQLADVVVDLEPAAVAQMLDVRRP